MLVPSVDLAVIGHLAAAGVIDRRGGQLKLGVASTSTVPVLVSVSLSRISVVIGTPPPLTTSMVPSLVKLPAARFLIGAGGAADRLDLAVIGDLAAAGVVDRRGGQLKLGVRVDQHGAGVGQRVAVEDQRRDRARRRRPTTSMVPSLVKLPAARFLIVWWCRRPPRSRRGW